MSQAAKSWLGGPYRYSSTGELWVSGELRVVDPAFRFGVQWVDKLCAVGDLKRSATNAAILVRTHIKLPSWAHLAQICMLCDRKGESRPLVLAKADRADAYNSFP